MVPMDKGDVFDIVDFKREGVRPRLITAPAASCTSCPKGMADSVAFVVEVDKTGRVTDTEVQGRPDGSSPRAEEVAAAKEALSSWRFEPARLYGKPLIDFCNVSVPVRGR